MVYRIREVNESIDSSTFQNVYIIILHTQIHPHPQDNIHGPLIILSGKRFKFISDSYGCKSNSQSIQTGVPQVFILGPLLFLFYTNDPYISGNILNMIMYTDDTILYCNVENCEDIEYIINNELSIIQQCLTSNKLLELINKTKCMFFHTKKLNIIPISEQKLYTNQKN